MQFKKDYYPYYNNEIKEKTKVNNNLLNIAINSNHLDDWRNFKNDRKSLSKITEDAKSEYFKNQFKSKNCQWSFLKSFNNTNGQQIPNNINFEGKQITSSRKIAIIAGDFFIEKI